MQVVEFSTKIVAQHKWQECKQTYSNKTRMDQNV